MTWQLASHRSDRSQILATVEVRASLFFKINCCEGFVIQLDWSVFNQRTFLSGPWSLLERDMLHEAIPHLFNPAECRMSARFCPPTPKPNQAA